MSKAELSAVVFDREDFPLSPHVLEYVAYEEPHRIVIVGQSPLQNQFNEFVVKFPECEQVLFPHLSGGSHTMKVHVSGHGADPIINFDVYNNQTAHIVDTVQMAQGDFISRFVLELGNLPKEEMIKREESWSVDYLKGVFGGKLEGDDTFWYQFNGVLDVALLPVNIRMDRLRSGLPDKPFTVQTQNAELN